MCAQIHKSQEVSSTVHSQCLVGARLICNYQAAAKRQKPIDTAVTAFLMLPTQYTRILNPINEVRTDT